MFIVTYVAGLNEKDIFTVQELHLLVYAGFKKDFDGIIRGQSC